MGPAPTSDDRSRQQSHTMRKYERMAGSLLLGSRCQKCLIRDGKIEIFSSECVNNTGKSHREVGSIFIIIIII